MKNVVWCESGLDLREWISIHFWQYILFQANSTDVDSTAKLLDHLKKGPVWKFHGFLRACVASDQEHVVTMLEINVDDYKDHPPLTLEMPPASRGKVHYYQPPDSDEKIPIPHELFEGKSFVIFSHLFLYS